VGIVKRKEKTENKFEDGHFIIESKLRINLSKILKNTSFSCEIKEKFFLNGCTSSFNPWLSGPTEGSFNTYSEVTISM
jgi:hypothetical protein